MQLSDTDWKCIVKYFDKIKSHDKIKMFEICTGQITVLKYGINDSPFDKYLQSVEIEIQPNIFFAILNRHNIKTYYNVMEKVYCTVPICYDGAHFLYQFTKFGHQLNYYSKDQIKIDCFLKKCAKLNGQLLKISNRSKDFVIPVKKVFFKRGYEFSKNKLLGIMNNYPEYKSFETDKNNEMIANCSILINSFFSYYEHICILLRIMMCEDTYMDIKQTLQQSSWMENFKFLFHIDKDKTYKELYDNLVSVWNNIRIPLIHGGISEVCFLKQLNIGDREYYLPSLQNDFWNNDSINMAKIHAEINNILKSFDKAIELLSLNVLNIPIRNAYKYLDVLYYVSSNNNDRKTYQQKIIYDSIKFDKFIDECLSEIDMHMNCEF
jgi:hypothetical protein